MNNPLPRSYFEQSPLTVAKDLIGKYLTVKTPLGVVKSVIVETEAYLGHLDPASHAYKRQTKSNEVMFLSPGVLYVYFTYGMHYCMNVKCWPYGTPGAVLFRGIEPIKGVSTLLKIANKSQKFELSNLTNGPAKLTKVLKIDKSYNGLDICLRSSTVKIFPNDDFKGKICKSPRIGISKNKDKQWRFYLDGNKFVSHFKQSNFRC